MGKSYSKEWDCMELRPYQKESIKKIHQAWLKHRSVMFQMPTGTGKTVIFNEIAHGERQHNNHVLIIAHRQEIVKQIVERLEKSFHKPVGIIMSQSDKNPQALIQVASIQTLHSRKYPYSSASKVIIDEAHHATAETYKKLWVKYPNAQFLGVTATPIRLNGEGFTDLFDFLITSDSISNFIKQGYLSQIKYLGNPQIVPDLRKIKDKGGDFDPYQLSKEMRQEKIMANLTKSYLEFAKDKKIIVFAVDIEHSKSIVERYQKLGINAEHINANTQKIEREQILERFRKGETKILSNVNIVSEGFDMPDYDGVQLARPTKSLGLYLQQIGRCMRPAEGKDYAIILDNVGLYEIFGSPKKLRNWNLVGNKNIQNQINTKINKLCEFRDDPKPTPLENNFSLVVIEDIEMRSSNVIKNQISKLEKKINILLEEKKVAVDKTIQDEIENQIIYCKQKIAILTNEYKKVQEIEKRQKVNGQLNLFKDKFAKFINAQKLINTDQLLIIKLT
jgi:superfamily II DNA or RNA helicase